MKNLLFAQCKAAPETEAALKENDFNVTTVGNIYETIVRLGGSKEIDYVLMDYFIGNHTAEKVIGLLDKFDIPYKIMIPIKQKVELDSHIMIMDKDFDPDKLPELIQQEIEVHENGNGKIH